MIGPTIQLSGKQQVEQALKSLAKRLEEKDYQVLVGVPHGNPTPEGSDINLATIAAINEFGTRLEGSPAGFVEKVGAPASRSQIKIPARPFLRPGVEENQGKIVRTAELGLLKVITGEQPMSWLLHRMGNIAQSGVQQYMTDLKDPPNAASTIRKKKSDNPLIDTGALRQSITYEVIIGAGEEIEEGIDVPSGGGNAPSSIFTKIVNRLKKALRRG